MSSDVFTLPDTVTPREAFDRLHAEHRRFAPVVGADGTLVGIMTAAGGAAVHALRPGGGRRRSACGSARRSGSTATSVCRAKALLAAGIDVLVVDTAHGHQDKMLDALRRDRARPAACPIVAGNVVTPAGTRDLIDAGADIVKVGVGPGAMCTTRMTTGVGRPQFSAVLECAAAAARAGPARLGRRRRAPPPRRRARPGRRCQRA